jgi:hypothetical protein
MKRRGLGSFRDEDVQEWKRQVSKYILKVHRLDRMYGSTSISSIRKEVAHAET